MMVAYILRENAFHGKEDSKKCDIKIKGGSVLGTYESEERAKEVMDMIEDHIKTNYVNKMVCEISSRDVSFTQLYDFLQEFGENAIFTMPKE